MSISQLNFGTRVDEKMLELAESKERKGKVLECSKSGCWQCASLQWFPQKEEMQD